MMFGNRPAQPEAFCLSTGAAALSTLGPRASDRRPPVRRGTAAAAASGNWPASARAGTIRSLTVWITTACVLVMAVTSVVTDLVEPPPSLPGVTVVDAQQARALMDAGAAMIDTRAAAHYERRHIAGARNVAYEGDSANEASFDHTRDSFDLTKLPADKTLPLVLYCNARPCWSSYKASKAAAAAGYRNVNWLRGGLAEWVAHGHEPATHELRRGRTP